MDTGKPTLDAVIRWMEQHQAGAVVPGTSRMLRAAQSGTPIGTTSAPAADTAPLAGTNPRTAGATASTAGRGWAK